MLYIQSYRAITGTDQEKDQAALACPESVCDRVAVIAGWIAGDLSI